MTVLKTKRNRKSVTAFLNAIEDPDRRRDCKVVHKLMREVTGKKAAMWGDSIVGYGSYHYQYASGREGDWFVTGFAPRKNDLTLYIMSGFSKHAALLEKLGKHKTGKSCLSIKRLDEVDLHVLRELIEMSVEQMKQPAN